jgi:hypothetical protein
MEEWNYRSTNINLGTTWRMVSFTPLRLYTGRKKNSTHWIGGFVGPSSDLKFLGKKKIFSFQERNPGLAVHSSSLLPTNIIRLSSYYEVFRT